MGKTSEHPGYVKMKDTPWIKQGRQIADIGGKGILSNYNNVNVFDQATKDSLEARNNAVYQRAFSDMNKNYNDIMNSYAARNYNRFGSLNNTPSSYVIDNYQKDFQRQMNDLSYNKAMNYENLINNELNRRYKTLGMFEDLYGYGQTPYEQDLKNWNIDNTNRDIAYKNQVMRNNSNNVLSSIFEGLGTAASTGLNGFTGGLGGALGKGVASNILGGRM